MAHFAKLNENNVVIEVIVINNDILDPDNEELSGLDFLLQWSNGHENWKQTSYNGKTRGKYAGIGDTYNVIEDIFIVPQPHASWTRDGSYWKPPVPYPTDGKFYQWNETELQWDAV